MKCDIIKDLIPLYSEGLCGEESKKEVEEHIRTCSACESCLKNLPKAEIVSFGTDEAVPFKKVKKRLKLRVALIIFLALILLSVVSVLGYMTYCQINHPYGGVSFDSLILSNELKPVGKMLADGDMEGYADSIVGNMLADGDMDGYAGSISEFAMNMGRGMSPDSQNCSGVVLQKLKDGYERVKQYSPKPGKIRFGYFGDQSTEAYMAEMPIIFTLSDGREYEYAFYMVRQGDGKFIATNQLCDTLNMKETLGSAGEDIAVFVNSVLVANGIAHDNELKAVAQFINHGSSGEGIAGFVKKRFAPEDRESVFEGITTYFEKGYSIDMSFSLMRFDEQKQSIYYLVTLIGRDGDITKIITIRLYADEYGFYSPNPDDITGADNSDLCKALSEIFG